MTDQDDTPQPQKYRFLDALMSSHLPSRPRGTRFPEPLWAADMPDLTAHFPAYTWEREGFEHVTDRVLIDHNGSFMAPLSGTWFAHGGLVRTGAHADTRSPAPGYHLIDVHRWSDPRMPSPLGGITGDVVKGARTVERARGGVSVVRRAWVAAPTVELLHTLAEAGHWPDVTVYDSWTPQDGFKTRFEAWAKLLKKAREDAIATGDPAAKAAAKDGPGGYVRVFQMFIRNADDPKSIVNRPDWNHTIRAQHAANLWRKLWQLVNETGIPVLRIRRTDEVFLSREGYEQLLDTPDAPVKLDLTGIKLGAFKLKEDDGK
jgi:hypothetical protein